jgi:hypothetical protein
MTKRPRDEENDRNSLGVALVLTGCVVLVALALWAPVARVQLIDSGLPAILAVATFCLTAKARLGGAGRDAGENRGRQMPAHLRVNNLRTLTGTGRVWTPGRRSRPRP